MGECIFMHVNTSPVVPAASILIVPCVDTCKLDTSLIFNRRRAHFGTRAKENARATAESIPCVLYDRTQRRAQTAGKKNFTCG